MLIRKRPLLALRDAVPSPGVWDPPGGLVRSSTRVDAALDFATDVIVGLCDHPRWLPCRWLYDERGSRLFELICETPEYYLTRTETAILATSAATIRDLTGPVSLVELGSGNSVKTGHLLSAFAHASSPTRYVPVDVSETALRDAVQAIAAAYPSVRVHGVHGRYEAAFPLLRKLSPAMLLFLGSTIGNFNQTEASLFWGRVARYLRPGDFVLLGVDLVKDEQVLNAAYNDAAGHSAEFTRNLFSRMNHELGAGVDLDAITHQARYNEEWRRIEIHARFETDQTIHVRPLQRTVRIPAGGRIMTEISRKYVLGDLEQYLTCFGLNLRHVFADERRWFAVVLLQRSRRPSAIGPEAGSPGL
ncbi:MAG: L-histidine N(alpha)-methyltransferase [Gemmatimonadetes bacterium]|nr:L-histidine N(alpha)-methyltransferase [Gemmatimonadota bacterium]